MHIALLPRRSFHGKLIGVSLYQFLFLIVCRSGGLANVFGRRPILLGGLLFFAVGSAMCGAAVNMKYVIALSAATLSSQLECRCSTMLAGRALQGVGSGVILSLVEIVLADLVSLSERYGTSYSYI